MRAIPSVLVMTIVAGTIALEPRGLGAQEPDWPRVAGPGAQYGIYGWAHEASLEPNAETPDRLRLCGTFVVNAQGAPRFHLPETGCLHFSRPSAAVPADWRELQRLAEAGSPMTNLVGGIIRGLVGFGSPDIAARVRVRDEADAAPDVYAGGEPVALVPYALAPASLGSTPKPPHTVNYAVVEGVRAVPGGSEPGGLRIDGLFAMQSGARYAYGPVQRGYLYVTGVDAATVDAWQRAAGSGRVTRFYVFASPDADVRLRRPDEPSGAPDRLPTWGTMRPTAVETPTDFQPIRALRDRR